MNLNALKTEIDTDPLARGYAGMSDAAVADSLNVIDRTINRTSMSGSEILNAVDASEWATRGNAQKQVVWHIVHLGNVNPFGLEATLIADAFRGAGGVTIAALADARKTGVSRAVELGLNLVKAGYVQQVRL